MNSVFFLGIPALHMKQVENRNNRVFEMKSAILYSGIIFGKWKIDRIESIYILFSINKGAVNEKRVTL